MTEIPKIPVARRVVLIVSLLLLAVMMEQAHATSPPVNVCQANLMVINGAIQQWALDRNLAATNTYSFQEPELIRYFKDSRVPTCPSSGVYLPARSIADPPICTLHGPLGNPVNVELHAIQIKANQLNLLTYSVAVLLAWMVSAFSPAPQTQRKQMILTMPVLMLLLINVVASQTSPSDEGGYLIRQAELPLLLLGSACGLVLCKSTRPAVRIYGLAFAIPFGLLGLGHLAAVFGPK